MMTQEETVECSGQRRARQETKVSSRSRCGNALVQSLTIIVVVMMMILVVSDVYGDGLLRGEDEIINCLSPRLGVGDV